MSAPLGIEKMRVYPGSLSLDLAALCDARGHDPADLRDNLLVDRRSLNPLWEDAVTMAVNAADPLLTDDDRRSIDLLVVGTETSVDQEKALSTWLHRHLRLPSHCRNFELKHACYSGTAALQVALAWLAASDRPDARALVVTTDQSLVALGQPYEFVCGAGAAAMLVSRAPDLFEVERGRSGVYAAEVTDVIRPTPRVETGSSETSLYAYLEAVEGALAAYGARVGDVDLAAWFARHVYHVPFGGMTLRAHRALLSALGVEGRAAARADWERRTLPSLRYTRETGATYGSSVFVALLGLLAGDEALRAGDRVGVFSYGSGSCAELYSGLVGARAREVARAADLDALLAARRAVTVAEYEDLERARDASIGARRFEPALDAWYERAYRGRRRLVLRRVEDYVREYAWS